MHCWESSRPPLKMSEIIRSNPFGQDGKAEPTENRRTSRVGHSGPSGIMKKSIDSGFDAIQRTTSRNNLASVKTSMIRTGNSVRAAAHEQEFQHVMNEDSKKKKLEAEIEEEDVACKGKFEQISQKWKELLFCKAPQELAQQITEQCKACEGLLESKRKLAELIRGELKTVDEDYHRMFHQQAKDVDTLVVTMGSQVIDLHNTHIQELTTIESDFLAQRKELLQRNKGELDSLMKKIRMTENSIKENLMGQIEDYARSLDMIRTQDVEDYNLLKSRLETDIQTLEQHLESMKAAYQLNTEKLDYNYAVLVERDHDNYVTAGQQKRKLTKQRDTLCALKGRHGDNEKRFLLQNTKLTSDYAKVIKLLQDLQSKERQLQAAQERQHWEFLSMHNHSLTVLVSKVLQVDKMIHEQQLGWQWHPPCKQLLSLFGYSMSSDRKPVEGKLCKSIGVTRVESCQDSSERIQNSMISCSQEFLHTGEGTNDILEAPCPKDALAMVKVQTKKLPTILEVEKIWRSYAGVIEPKVLHVWAIFGMALMGYNHLLKNRWVCSSCFDLKTMKCILSMRHLSLFMHFLTGQYNENLFTPNV